MSVTPALLQKIIFSHPAIQSFNPYSRAVLEKLKHCHTAQIGMHRFQIDDPNCMHIHWQYHSCGNRAYTRLNTVGCGGESTIESTAQFRSAYIQPII